MSSRLCAEAGQPCRRPLCVSVGEQMCWSTVATTGCVHWCGISTVSVGVSRPEQRGEGSCSPTLQRARKRGASHACAVTVYAGARKHNQTQKSINQSKTLAGDATRARKVASRSLHLISLTIPYMEAISPLCCWLLRTGGILFPLY